MRNYRAYHLLHTSCVLALSLPVAAASEPWPDPTVLRGVVAVTADMPVTALARLAQAAPVTVMAVVRDSSAADTMREQLSQAGVLGQVIVRHIGADGRVPLLDGTAAMLVHDPSTMPALTDAEIARCVRPFGAIVRRQGGGWATSARPAIAGMANWTHYNGDAANSQNTNDTLVAEPRGIQWVAGPTDHFKFMVMKDAVAVEQFRTKGSGEIGLVGRDAFSGMPLWWHKGINPVTRFALVLHGDSLLIHVGSKQSGMSPHTEEWNAATGEKLRTFTEGMSYATKEGDMAARKAAFARGEDLTLQVVDGVLVQSDRRELVAIDLATGTRLDWVQPASGGGLVVVGEGPWTKSSAYTHWPMVKPQRLAAFDLHSGAPVWEYRFTTERHGALWGLYNIEIEGGRLCAGITDQQGGQVNALVLDLRSGTQQFWGRDAKGSWEDAGRGHSHARVHLRDGKGWSTGLEGPKAVWSWDDVSTSKAYLDLFPGVGKNKPQLNRPLSCTVWRSVPGKWIGGTAIYPMDGTSFRPYFNRSGRSDCDIGGFPANGMIYLPPNTCPCLPFLSGTKAYHSRQAPTPISASERLLRGAGAMTQDPAVDPAAWGQHLQGPARRMWVTGELPQQLQLRWSAAASTTARLPDLLSAQWQADSLLRGAVTAPVVASGLVAVAEGHRHVVVVRDAKTGSELWRRTVDARVDVSPTIAHGMVLAGTRAGSVYAWNGRSGDLVWRFTAAPGADLMAVNGQLESPWPVFGSVTVDDAGVWVIAGRHGDTDGGLWWFVLDPATGATRRAGRFGHPDGNYIAASTTWKLPARARPIQNSLPVLTDRFIGLPDTSLLRNGLDLGEMDADGYPSSAGVLPANKARDMAFEELVVGVGSNTFVGEAQQQGGFSKPWFGNTLGRLYAFDVRSRQLVSVGGRRGQHDPRV
jgi:outer membrane protein assembly factor BamB